MKFENRYDGKGSPIWMVEEDCYYPRREFIVNAVLLKRSIVEALQRVVRYATEARNTMFWRKQVGMEEKHEGAMD